MIIVSALLKWLNVLALKKRSKGALFNYPASSVKMRTRASLLNRKSSFSARLPATLLWSVHQSIRFHSNKSAAPVHERTHSILMNKPLSWNKSNEKQGFIFYM